MIKPATGNPFTVGDTSPVKLNALAETDYHAGLSLLISTNGSLHFGGDTNVRNTAAGGGSTYREALFPAVTFMPIDLDAGEDVYVIAPASQSVTVEVLEGGV
jgi:hypothetical protein